MAYRAGVVGGSGYTGAELLRLLASHPEIEVVTATADTHAGRRLGDVYPSLAARYPDLVLGELDPRALAGLDVVFVGLPHGASQRTMPALVEQVGHVVDLGADFRLPASVYERWYGEAHSAPELLGEFAFGMVELFRAEIAQADHVASPGCYPTASALALAPLFADGLAEPDGVIVDAMSGVSGAGRGLKLTSHFSAVAESVSAYGLLTHRHTAEIELALSHVAQAPVSVLFTPHLVPMVRGIQATCHARPARDGLDTAMLLEAYRSFYADDPFVLVTGEPSPTKATLGANTCHVTVRFDERTGSILALGAIDNLGKGASGQAMQSANLLLGLTEDAGLSTVGMWP
jgi:N-acetyl-gamma-glutamyl-phosphate reductase